MEGYTEKLALFQKRPNNTGELTETYIDYKSQGQLNNEAPLHFHVANNGLTYIDLSKSRLAMKLKITRKDGVAMKNTDLVGTSNIPLHALWRRMELFLRDKLVSGSDTMYPYKAYIDYITKMSDREQKTIGSSVLFNKDTPGTFDFIPEKPEKTDGYLNQGFGKRFLKFRDGATVELIDTPKLDFFYTDKLLLNGIPLDLKLFPSPSDFVLLCKKNDYVLNLLECTFRVCHVRVNPEILFAHDEVLKKGKMAEYHFDHNDLKSYTIAPGLSTFSVDNMWLDRVPRNLMLAFVDSDRFNGKIDKNPFSFEHNNTQQIALYVNGTPVPNRPIEADFERKLYTDAYLRLEEKNANLSLYEFGNNYTLFNMNIRPDDTIGARGYTRMEIKFGKPLEKATVLLLYATFDKTLSISHERSVNVTEN